ncbi:DUF1801 domain-containing protein [Flavobacterium sp.]|uniref:DUF1801 domain-containing protein n=1 Tax=Flavobacterium sp. TaxID=239 RepID=UPI002C3B5F51|nr:DUF1801 domain-containing protein [Flavobacterium sp.]HSD06799.1 DUF1801 domain-containing protein [Flavobacterium sp.]
MATKNKTTETNVDVKSFINQYVDDEQKKSDSLQLIELMEKWTGFAPKMWGPTIIGFGYYQYKYESGHSGEAPLIGFSPRKTAFSMYVYLPTQENDQLLKDLGKFKMAKACIYVKKLSDINMSVLEKICKSTVEHIKQKYD